MWFQFYNWGFIIHRSSSFCWRSRDELISDILQWTPSHVREKEGRSARTYIQQLWEDTRCSPGDLPEAMNDRVGWRERVRDISADGATRWWWWWWWFIEDFRDVMVFLLVLYSILNNIVSTNRVVEAPNASLQKVKTATIDECPWYDIKLYDGEAQARKLWGMWSATSLLLLSG